MYYLEENCVVCGDGILGFLRCSDGKKIVIMCEECNSVWLTPGEVSHEDPIYTEAPDYLLPDSNISISGNDSGWASLDEIKSAGFEDYVSNERQYEP
jgi:hypothetical protein